MVSGPRGQVGNTLLLRVLCLCFRSPLESHRRGLAEAALAGSLPGRPGQRPVSSPVCVCLGAESDPINLLMV